MKLKTCAVLYICFLALFCGKSPLLEAQTFSEYLGFAYNGSLVLLASNNGSSADPAQIVPSFGFAVNYPILERLKIEITEDLYFSNYEYNRTSNHPMACTPDNREAFVLGFVTGVNATGFFQNTRSDFAFRVFGGLTADLRVVTLAFGLNSYDIEGENGAEAGKNAILNYFWSKGRFLFASGGVGFDFPVNDNFLMGVELRTWYPLYRLWTGEDIPFIDGWRFSLGMRVTPRKYIPPLWQRQQQRQPAPVQPKEEEPDEQEAEEIEAEEIDQNNDQL